MKPEILLVAPLMPQCIAALDDRSVVHRLWEAREPDTFLQEIGPGVRAIVTNGAAGTGNTLIRSVPGLEVIVSCGSFSHIIRAERSRLNRPWVIW
jgi:hypothetical protein